jgi:hypothetical protein
MLRTSPKQGLDMTISETQPIAGRAPASTRVLSADEMRDIAIDAYIYAYPLVLSEVTRRSMTNVETPRPGKAPMNQFMHMPAFPDPSFTDVVRPNADTLYSILWFDVAKEPLLMSAPDSGGRYYLLQMMDLWTEVFDAPGSRTTGAGPQTFAITGPDWRGRLPGGATQIRSPTAIGCVAGRTQTNGAADYPNVHKFQAGLAAVPLSQWGKDYKAPKGQINSDVDMKTAPVDQVGKMSAAAFFSLFAELAKFNPPHEVDYPILHRLERIGLEPGEPFSTSELSSEVRAALEKASQAALPRIMAAMQKCGVLANGWRIDLTGIGSYGSDYLHRAGVAYAGWGANVVDDAVYPTAFLDADGKPFSSDRRYRMHFEKGKLPPARAFWSLTMYDQRQLFTANPINRYAIGDRNKLKPNADGSLDLIIQRDSPGPEMESNWLPAPKSGAFTMNMRLYWPKPEVVDGDWAPPPVRMVQ